MQRLIVLILMCSLTGCSLARGVGGMFGGGKKKNFVSGAPNAVDTNPGVSGLDMDRAEKQLPRGLTADTENASHTGEAIQPQ